MEYFDLIAKGYSARAYKPDPVEEEKLQAVLEAARLAPTAANRQPFQLIVIHTSGERLSLSAFTGENGLLKHHSSSALVAYRVSVGCERTSGDIWTLMLPS